MSLELPDFTGDKEAYTQAVLDMSPPRYAELGDVDRLAEFDYSVFPEDGGLFGNRYFTKHINNHPTGIEIVEAHDQIAACIIGDMHPSETEANRYYGDIASLGIAADHRGHGLGDLLLSRMMERMLSENPTGISLHTRVSNLAMQGLATTHGFKVEDTVPDYYIRTAVPEDAFLMMYRPDNPR